MRSMRLTDIHAAMREAGCGMTVVGLRYALDSEAYWAGDELYGSLRHVEAAGDPDHLCERAAEAMAEAPHRRWGVVEITQAGWDGASRPDPYILAHVMRHAGRFTFHKHGKFSLPDAAGGMASLSLNEAAEAIIERMGRPVRGAEIIAILREERGVGTSNVLLAQGHGTGRLFRLDRGLWGLIDRDMPVSPDQAQALVEAVDGLDVEDVVQLDAVHARLGDRGVDLAGVTPTLLGFILRESGRYEVGRLGTIRPAGTGQAADRTLHRNIELVLADAAGPMTKNEIAVEVGRRFGRLPSHSTLRVVLLRCGRHEPGTKPARWTARTAP